MDSLELAKVSIQKLRHNSRWALVMPFPFIALILWGFGQFDAHWYRDPFIGAIGAVFLFGQIMSAFQHRLFLRGASKVSRVLDVLQKSRETGLSQVMEALRALPDGHFRDLILRIARPLQVGDSSLAQNLLDSAANRRSTHENRRMAQHSSINRTILKLGFLGTLIGLLLTFPPMKEAMMSLNSSGGELKFVGHIASALDGDRFAIFATLIATGLSLMIELITIQMLERSFGRFENTNSLAEEWILAESVSGVSRNPAEWTGNMAQMQIELHRNLATLADLVRTTTRRIDDVREMQGALEKRWERLHDLSKEDRA